MDFSSLRFRRAAFTLLAALTLVGCGGTGGEDVNLDGGAEASALAPDASDSSPPIDSSVNAADATLDAPPGDAPAVPDSATAPDASDGASDAATDGPPVEDATDGSASLDATDATLDGALDASSDGSTGDAGESADTGAIDASPSCDAGFLDPTFGSCGIFSAAVPAPVAPSGTDSFFLARAIAIQSTGNIVVGGAVDVYTGGNLTSEQPYVMRVLADGSGVDTSFASDGFVSFPGSSFESAGVSIAQQSDGALLVGTICPTNVPGKTLNDFCVYRLSADGAVDSTYGSSGVAHVSTSPTEDDSSGLLTLDAQGRGLVAGFAGSGGTVAYAYVIRLTTAGAIDPTFNGGAPFVTAQMSSAGLEITGVAALPSGRMFYESQDSALAALTASGTPDDTVDPGPDGGGSSSVPVPVGFEVSDLVIAPDNSVYAFGGQSGTGGIAIVKVTPAGALDGTFGTGGEVMSFSPPGSSFFAGAALVGSGFYALAYGDGMYKIGIDGGVNAAWGSGGFVSLASLPSSSSSSSSIAWSPWLMAASARGPLVAGYSSVTNPLTVFLARLLP